VRQADRETFNGHQAVVLWLTGLSGSGKSTLARHVDQRLFELGCHSFILDGDNVRHALNRDLGFSPEDREENIRRIGEVAGLFVQAGVIVLTAFISPYRVDRARARANVPEGRFIEVYVQCPLEMCEFRDPKGLYKKARAGQIAEFTGISAPYEPPINPELAVNTGEQTPGESAERVILCLRQRGVIA
jgi:adenylylsulfate kinase